MIEEYFDLLFNEDTVTTGVTRSHRRRLPDSIIESTMVKRIEAPAFVVSKGLAPRSPAVPSQGEDTQSPLTSGTETEDTALASSSGHDESQAEKAFGDFNSFMGRGVGSDHGDARGGEENLQITSAVAAKPKGPEAPDLTLTEFLRVNMRLAEDRVLSFVLVFCTGFGTKWVPGATFYYEPEVSFQTLLTQRRRWINGTVASYFYFFTSQRARLRVQGGFFVSYFAVYLWLIKCLL